MGAKRIILGVRSLEKGEAALSTLRNDTGRQDVGEVWPLDLLSLDSVEAFAKRMSTLDRLDGLIANAGVVMTQFQIIEGIESSLLVNVVSTLLLGLRALPKLQDSAHKLGTKPHLVFVLSRTALERKVELNLEQLQGDMFDALGKEEDFKPLLQ
jgi:NAD(P)-dependent dehydrogenase (short-subunit alcohol dehydrogenase family)